MSFELNNEKATDVLIWWVQGSDGAINYREEDEVKEVLEEMNYSMETYNQEMKMKISGLSNEKLEQLIEESIRWSAEHFDEHRKKKTVLLLKKIARCDGEKEAELEKIKRIEKAFGLK